MIDVLFGTSILRKTLLVQDLAYHIQKIDRKNHRVFMSCSDFLGGLVFCLSVVLIAFHSKVFCHRCQLSSLQTMTNQIKLSKSVTSSSLQATIEKELICQITCW
jgi:hypothetical protein